jgi:hypothetical protein
MGAANSRQAPSDAVASADQTSLTCSDTPKQALRTPAFPVRDEEAAGSNPATPTSVSQVRGHFRSSGSGLLRLLRDYACCLAALPSLSPDTNSLDGPVENGRQALGGLPAVDHCEQLKVPLPARVVHRFQPGHQPTAKLSVVGGA